MAYPLVTIAQKLLDTAQGALTMPVDQAHISPGNQVAWDGGNLLAVRLVSVSTDGSSKCPQVFARFGVVVLRCVEALTAGGSAPWSSDITLDASPILRDCHEVGSALLALEREGLPCALGVALGEWASEGPQGGVAGGEWPVDIHLQTLGYTP